MPNYVEHDLYINWDYQSPQAEAQANEFHQYWMQMIENEALSKKNKEVKRISEDLLPLPSEKTPLYAQEENEEEDD